MSNPSLYLHNIIKAIRNPSTALMLAARGFRDRFLWDRYFRMVPEPKIRSSVPRDGQEKVIADLEAMGLRVLRMDIDVGDYRAYMEKADYDRYPGYYIRLYENRFVEKSLEHYLAYRLLDLSIKDVYIDIANAGSPTPEIYSRLSGCRSFRQDLIYEKGIRGDVIGGDAGSMPVEDGFATKMALHCSFEHFEGDADIRFIRESGRVLRKGGRLCILPLYLHTAYSIQIDPIMYSRGEDIPSEPDAALYCAKGYRNRHARFYDARHFSERIMKNLDGLEPTLYVIRNERDVSPYCYVKFVALFEKA